MNGLGNTSPRIREMFQALEAEISRLKAEVELLRNQYEKDYQAMRNVADAWKAKYETAYDNEKQLYADCAQLKARSEKLAGALKKIIEKGIAADPLPELISVEIAKAALAEWEGK